MASFSDGDSTTPAGPDPNSPAAPPGRHRQTSTTVLAALARHPGYQLLFVVVAVAAAAVYTLMLPGLHTMRVAPSNWAHQTAQDLVFSMALGVGLATVLTLQVFALRQAAASRRAASGKAALGVLESVAAVVPSLCCTPVLPTVLAVVGVGAAGSASTMRAIAPHATLIWIGVLVLLALTSWWTAHRIAAADCCGPILDRESIPRHIISAAPPNTPGGDMSQIRGWWDRQKERFPGFELVPHLARLLADGGQPVTLERIAEAASWKVEDVDAVLHQHPGADWDEEGRLVGFGLTLRPTPHRFSFDGHTVYGFCASDALDFPTMLGRSGVIESTCPSTGQVIRVEVTPERVVSVNPATAVVSLVRPDQFRDIRAEGCDLGWFYASETAAAEWLAAHPEGMIHSVEEEFEQTREMMFRVGWAAVGEGQR